MFAEATGSQQYFALGWLCLTLSLRNCAHGVGSSLPAGWLRALGFGNGLG